jgi:hypothetical protein
MILVTENVNGTRICNQSQDPLTPEDYTIKIIQLVFGQSTKDKKKMNFLSTNHKVKSFLPSGFLHP